jgi:hypothetical protein
MTMPYFSAQQEDPRMRRAHRAIERLSDEAQGFLSLVMTDGLQLTEAQMEQVIKTCRVTVRRLRMLVAEGSEGSP